MLYHLLLPYLVSERDRQIYGRRDARLPGGTGSSHHHWKSSLPVVTTDIRIERKVGQVKKHTPILSTSILSRPRGPNELLMIFAIDCAAITTCVSMFGIRGRVKYAHHFGPVFPALILCHHQRRYPTLGRVGTYSCRSRTRKGRETRVLGKDFSRSYCCPFSIDHVTQDSVLEIRALDPPTPFV